jgi:hypothetical protein
LHLFDYRAVFHAHHGTLAELLLDLRQRGSQCFALVGAWCVSLVVHEDSFNGWVQNSFDTQLDLTAQGILYKKTVLYASDVAHLADIFLNYHFNH